MGNDDNGAFGNEFRKRFADLPFRCGIDGRG